MNDKYLSVITNFGCHYSCPYCIVKNNHLNIPKTTIHGLIKILGVIVMVKVRDILPLIQWNDAQIIKDQDEEICLLRNDFMVGSLSEEILNMTVTGIENDENIENTVVVYVTDEED